MRRFAAYGAAMTFAALYLPPWEAWLGEFAGHMLRHMGLVAVAAPLVVLAAPGLARRVGLPVMLGVLIEFVIVWFWHLPGLHGPARLSLWVAVVEQASFFAAGWAVWASALTAREPLLGAGGLFVTSMHMTLLGALLILAPNDLYAEICGRAPNLTGQQLGGMLMLGIGTPIYLFGALALARSSLREDANETA
ncbi:cytochrome c oxidase assembly protein [Roseovarius sp. SCSIO 43702]|uniref:cytochrome c oxidase assembly protein n=1 Tax=Roseovarius sp. SCSIO 43702 TaxID=2823043 RepID=UPI001C731843|nr:cytochrome c oxidase assembly protein [Roseovarius sp. SCSIO 43702]QYX56889.1 cytochrome c oxidase assembly protein [Roseovarius sp. SCSIO 43702]